MYSRKNIFAFGIFFIFLAISSYLLPKFSLKDTAARISATLRQIQPDLKNVLQAASCTNDPVDVILVLDRSQSMKGQKFADAKAAAAAFVDYIAQNSNNRIAFIHHDDDAVLASPFTNNFGSVKSKVLALTDGAPATCIQCSMLASADEFRAHSRPGYKNVVAMLSDGRATNIVSGKVSRPEAAQAAMDATNQLVSSQQAAVFTIGFGSDANTLLLQQMANASGGQYFPYSSGSMQSAFQQISQLAGRGSISGYVFNDGNNNLTKDSSESTLPNWKVNLTGGGINIYEYTDQSGGYSFTGLCDATYSVNLTQQSRWVQTIPVANGGYSVPVSNNSNPGKDFGVRGGVPNPTAAPTPTPTPVLPTATPDPLATPTPTPDPLASPTPTVIPTPTPLPLPTPTNVPPPSSSGISGFVYKDTNRNGIRDAGETGVQDVDIVISENAELSAFTDVGGNYSFGELLDGSYVVSIILPEGYVATTPKDVPIIVPPNQIVSFGIMSDYSISGTVFIDLNKNRIFDPGESNVMDDLTISAGAGVFSYLEGNYLINNLPAGTYTVSLNSLMPPGFVMVYPLNGPPPSIIVTLGSPCSVADPTTGGSCDGSGNVVNLNFAITDSIPWIQGQGMDMRFDEGMTNFVPSAPACSGAYALIPGSSTSSGILFTGDKSPDFGKGRSSTEGWVVGGSSYPETYKTTATRLPSSYASILAAVNQSGTPIINLGSVCNTASCTLPNNLASGAYRSNGDLRLFGHRFRNNANYIFLINGSLSIVGNIDVPNGSTALFSAANDILIDSSVGANPACNAQSNLQGFYSADQDFIVQGINDCTVGPDKMLRIEGTVFVNAALSGGVFTNERDLCVNNYEYPSLLFIERSDFIINAPSLLRKKGLIFQEEAP